MRWPVSRSRYDEMVSGKDKHIEALENERRRLLDLFSLRAFGVPLYSSLPSTTPAEAAQLEVESKPELLDQPTGMAALVERYQSRNPRVLAKAAEIENERAYDAEMRGRTEVLRALEEDIAAGEREADKNRVQ